MRVHADIISGAKPTFDWTAEGAEMGAIEQALNLAQLPFVIHHVALMPDAHQGYGMPIGGVLFADRAVVPYAIGVDIGCGVTFWNTGLTVDDIRPYLDDILVLIEKLVPTGFKDHGADSLTMSAALALLGDEADRTLESSGDLYQWMYKALPQLGTLGGGNHFIELQKNDDDDVFLMLHSGSRSLGKNICDHFHRKALELNGRWHSKLPHKELAYLPAGTEEYGHYWEQMRFALRFAEVSRARMSALVGDAIAAFIPSFKSLTHIVDVHHNYAAWENHYGKNGIVHRKGAVRARLGDVVLIPGSMGTASYVARGLGNEKSFNTCQHGAGRAQTRTAMRKGMTREAVYQTMSELGVGLVSSDPSKVMEEAPSAYKDIESVMASSGDLIQPVMRLMPLGVVKG